MWLRRGVGGGVGVGTGGRGEEEWGWVTGWDGGGWGRGDCRLTSAFPPHERKAPRKLNRILPPHLHQTTCQSLGRSSPPHSLHPSLPPSIHPPFLPSFLRSSLHLRRQQPRLQNYGGVLSWELTASSTAVQLSDGGDSKKGWQRRPSCTTGTYSKYKNSGGKKGATKYIKKKHGAEADELTFLV